MFLFIISILALLVGVIIGIANFADGNRGAGTAATIIGVVLCVVLMLVSCIGVVPTGHTGVVTTFGQVEDYTLDSGLHFTAPWQKVVKMDNRVQKQTIELSCFSSDIQEVSMVYTVNYQISKTDAMTIYSTIGTDYYNTIIVPCVTESVKVVTARYNAEELISSRDELALAIEADIADKLIAYNIEVTSTSIEDMDFSDAYTNAVEEKQVAEQNKLRAETEAEQKVIEAEADAEVRRINAESEAYEVTTRAEAEAEANNKIAASLTEDLIAYIYAENWNGELPTYVAGDSSSTIPVLNFGE